MEIFDLHNDILTSSKNAKQIEKYLKNNQNATITAALWTSQLSFDQVKSKINEYKSLQNTYPNLRFAIEDFAGAMPIIDEIANLNPLYISLTWNDENELAGGAFSYGTLTDLGRKTIKSLNDKNIVIDTAHLNEKSFMEVLNESNKVICSHTAFSGVFAHNRNLKDYQIRMIIERAGIIGLTAVNDFLSPYKKVTTSDFVRHIEYFIDRYGDDNLAIGTDFFGTTNMPKGLSKYKSFEGLEKELKKIGYSDETIAKIFYKNAKNFFNEV